MQPLNRRAALARTSALLGAAAIGAPAWAQPAATWPQRTIRIVGAFTAGGPSDSISRTVAQRLSDTLGQPVIVDNRPGASGMIGADLVAKAPADGYTLLVTNQLLIQTPSLYSKVPYDPIRDLTPVTDLIASPLWLAVNAESSSIRSMADLIRQAKASANGFTYASVGSGSIGHLYGNRLSQAAGIQLTHVPYKGAAPVVLALLAGEVNIAFVDYATLKPHMAAGKLRALAMSDTKRSPLTPDVQTFTELGLSGFEASSWIGMFATAKTPPEVVNRLSSEVARILKQPDVVAKFQEQGFEMGGKSPAQFGTQVSTDMERWAMLIKQAGVKLD